MSPRIVVEDPPTLIVAVREDPGHPLATAEILAEQMPRAELRVVESLAEVDRIHAAAARFLEELGAAGC